VQWFTITSPLQKSCWLPHCGVAPENVVTAAGTSMANMLAMEAILEPGDEVLVEHPAYELLWRRLDICRPIFRRFSRRVENGFAWIRRRSSSHTPRTR